MIPSVGLTYCIRLATKEVDMPSTERGTENMDTSYITLPISLCLQFPLRHLPIDLISQRA
jgi:hypothetical protein